MNYVVGSTNLLSHPMRFYIIIRSEYYYNEQSKQSENLNWLIQVAKQIQILSHTILSSIFIKYSISQVILFTRRVLWAVHGARNQPIVIYKPVKL